MCVQLQTQTSPDSAAVSSVTVTTDDATRYLDTLQDDTGIICLVYVLVN